MESDISNAVRIVSREYWLDGVLASPCCALYVLFESGECLKASYNDEVCIWEVTGENNIPNFEVPDGDDFYYPYNDYTPTCREHLGVLISYNVQERNLLVFTFSNGVKVSLVYNPKSESESLDVQIT